MSDDIQAQQNEVPEPQPPAENPYADFFKREEVEDTMGNVVTTTMYPPGTTVSRAAQLAIVKPSGDEESTPMRFVVETPDGKTTIYTAGDDITDDLPDETDLILTAAASRIQVSLLDSLEYQSQMIAAARRNAGLIEAYVETYGEELRENPDIVDFQLTKDGESCALERTAVETFRGLMQANTNLVELHRHILVSALQSWIGCTLPITVVNEPTDRDGEFDMRILIAELPLTQDGQDIRDDLLTPCPKWLLPALFVAAVPSADNEMFKRALARRAIGPSFEQQLAAQPDLIQ